MSGTPQQDGVSRARPYQSRFLLRWFLLILGIVVFNLIAVRWLADVAETWVGAGWTAGSWIGIALLAVYAVLLAIPFVPGVKIGLSLLIMQGAAIAPFAHTPTVAELCMSYRLGHAFATRLPCVFLAKIGMPRAGTFVDEMKTMGGNERLQRLKNAAPNWVGRWKLDYRYLLVAGLTNLPGNSLIGGGGGILLIAGMSRLFPIPVLALAVALAMVPVQNMVWFFGAGVLQ